MIIVLIYNETYLSNKISSFVVLDIDECTEETHSCDINAVCNNSPGSYKCTCKDGFYGDYIDEKIYHRVSNYFFDKVCEFRFKQAFGLEKIPLLLVELI